MDIKSLIVALSLATSATAASVVIPVGTDFQSFVNKQASNTQFLLPAGMWRLTDSPTLKAGDSFVGTLDANGNPLSILNGSKLLTNFTASAGRWYVGGQTQFGNGSSLGSCMPGYGGCGYQNDLFSDDKPMQRVTSLAQVGPGKWFMDYKADRIYLGDNPAGHKIETSIAPAAFESSVSNVKITGLDIQKFATPSQSSAIQQDGGSGWQLTGNYVHLNHASGAELKTNGVARNNRFNDNGQEGITSSGSNNVLIDTNEIAGNNWAHYDPGWEAGGTKFWQTTNLTATRNNVHDNLGTGLWTDTQNSGTVYTYNTITNNFTAGISHEVSGSAKIQYNVLKGNGAIGWASISLESSYGADVSYNTVEVTVPQAAAILVYQANRELGFSAHDDYVHDNQIILDGAAAGNGHGLTGEVNVGSSSTKNIKFDYDTYYVPDSAAAKHWSFLNSESFSAFQSQGQELHGRVYVGQPSSLLTAAGGVPEPCSAGLLLAAFLGLVTRRRRGQQRSPV